jgi:hypothetical protein
MLIRLLSEQISNHWPIIKAAITESLPPIAGESSEKMNRILENLLCDKMQCWVGCKVDANKQEIEGVAVTTISYDFCSDTRSLLIYCLYGYQKIEKQTWLDGLGTLTSYARSKGCIRIIAYSNLDYIIGLAAGLGADVDYRLISFNI